MRGNDVLHPIGWDAFGLPAENAAIKRGIHPKEWTYANIDQQRSTFKRLGMSFDWSRQFNTCDPEYYRWTQWLFLQLFDRGLAYRKNAPTNWCPHDQTVLANEQVINGACERCGTAVVRKDLTQWFFKITDYAQRLLDDLETVEATWPERVVTMQRNWIGRSEGARVEFEIAETGDRVTVFTTRPDTLWGVTFFVFAPEHELVAKLADAGGASAEAKAMLDRLQATPLTNREQAESREGVPLGVHAVNPVNGERVPCFVAPYVLMEYGTGAVMGVPAHDQRDFEFAREHGLRDPRGDPARGRRAARPRPDERGLRPRGRDGELGPVQRRARRRRASGASSRGWTNRASGAAAVSFRLRDWLISRQRYWGAPIPIIHCPSCGEVGVPESDLPVLLPDDVDFRPGGVSPLARHEGFVNVTCPRCGGAAKRDTDTMDTFVDSSWYFLRYCSPHRDDVAFDTGEVERWLPVNQYTGGVEHAILHLLYSRFFIKALHDMGMVSFVEPFLGMMNQGQVIYDGASMSKSKGNLVEPMPIVERWGADTLRLTMLFAGPFEDDIDWKLIAPNPERPPGVHGWLGRAWRAVHDAVDPARASLRAAGGADPAAAPDDQRGHDGPGAVPVQRRDLEADGADERDPPRAGRGRGGAGGGPGAGPDDGAAGAVRRRGAVALGAGGIRERARVAVAVVRSGAGARGPRGAGRAGRRQGPRPRSRSIPTPTRWRAARPPWRPNASARRSTGARWGGSSSARRSWSASSPPPEPPGVATPTGGVTQFTARCRQSRRSVVPVRSLSKLCLARRGEGPWTNGCRSGIG